MPGVSQDFYGIRFKPATLEKAVEVLRSIVDAQVKDWFTNWETNHDPFGYPRPSNDQQGNIQISRYLPARITFQGRTRTFEDLQKFTLALRSPYETAYAIITGTHPLLDSLTTSHELIFSDTGPSSQIDIKAEKEVDAERILSVFLDAPEAEGAAKTQNEYLSRVTSSSHSSQVPVTPAIPKRGALGRFLRSPATKWVGITVGGIIATSIGAVLTAWLLVAFGFQVLPPAPTPLP